MKIILAIETSCDETGVAIVRGRGRPSRKATERQGKKSPDIHIVANELASQIAIHKKYGGVVPNLAAREHEKNLPIILRRALAQAKKHGVEQKNIDIIAVTKGPGLAPALWRGINFAKELAQKWNKPLIGIDHMEGHLTANFISNEVGRNPKSKIQNSKQIQNHPIAFPILCLTVSGGHTQLVLVKNWARYELLGETLDDAVGEAFDKVARMLGLPYPGGPQISKLAEKGKATAFPFPRPMLRTNDYNFSFSGLKTAVLYTIQKQTGGQTSSGRSDPPTTVLPRNSASLLRGSVAAHIAASFQQAVIDVLIAKTIRAAREYDVKTVMLAGGVAANKELRQQLEKAVKKYLPTTNYQLPTTQLCTDNAAMIGAAAYIRLAKHTHYSLPITYYPLEAEPARQITDK